jgi:hypothetical protein
LNSLLQPEERSSSCIGSGSAGVCEHDTAVCQRKVKTWLNVSTDTIGLYRYTN